MRFGILGPLQAGVGGVEVPLNGTRQTRVLAALLVAANQVVRIPTLVAVVWDGREPATAIRQVQDAVSGLRRNLTACGAPPDLIRTHRQGYRIGLDPLQLDLLEFQEACAVAERFAAAGDPDRASNALRRALDCWRGDALADVAGSALEVDAARFNSQRTAARRQFLALELSLDRHDAVADELVALVREHPFDERTAEQAVLALCRCGRRGEALELYERVRRALAEELGVDPAAPLRELHRRVLAADPTLSGEQWPAERRAGRESATGQPVPRQLPPTVADFTGRAEEVELIADRLGGPPSRSQALPVLVIAGCGGMGKTALAVHSAHRLRERFPDGQLFAALSQAGTPRPLRGPAHRPDQVAGGAAAAPPGRYRGPLGALALAQLRPAPAGPAR